MIKYENQFSTLNQVGKIARGKSKHRPRNDPSLYGGDYPFIQTGDVKHSNLYITDYSQTYNERGLAQSQIWEPGTLCITIAANIADTAILSFPACFPDSIIGFNPDLNKSDVRYIKYCLDTYKLQIQAISRGTTQDNLSLEKLLSIKLKCPPLPVQKKIAAVLSAYDDLIENNTHRIALLEKMVEEIYREWFVRLRFPGHEQTTFHKGIPEGWIEGTAADLADIMSGGTPKTNIPKYWNGEVPFLTPTDFGEGFYALKTENSLTIDGLKACNSKLYPRHTVFITARGTVGKLILNQCPMAVNQTCYALRGKGHVSQLYLFLAMRHVIGYFRKAATGGVFDTIVIKTFKSVPFVIPPSDLIGSFNDIARSLFRQMENLLVANEKLQQTRDRLLTRLISGKLSLEDLDIQFPPSTTDPPSPAQGQA